MTEKVLRLHRVGRKLSESGYSRAGRFLSVLIRLVFSAEIPSTCLLGKGVVLKHGGLGVVIHDHAIVGDGTVIYHNVTIGGREFSGTPRIGRNVYIGCGACVLGNVVIGDDVKVGANSVVLSDIPSGCTVVGIPARVVRGGGDK